MPHTPLPPRPTTSPPYGAAVRRGGALASLLTCILLAGCTPPVTIQRLGLEDAYRERSQSALDGHHLSTTTRIVLERQNLQKLWRKDPALALASLRSSTQAGFSTPNLPDQLFALAELSYDLGRRQRDRARFMVAALYAYAYLTPDAPPQDRPSPYNPHFRQACDIYMLALTEAMGTPVDPQSQRWTLPIGTLDLSADPTERLWHGYTLTDFQPTARLSVSGLKNIYSKPGMGEPLAAVAIKPTQNTAGQSKTLLTVSDKLRVPVSLFMQIPDPRRQVLSDRIIGRLILKSMDGAESGAQAQNTPPLQYDQSATRAISLNQNVDWSSEYKGFLDGRFFDGTHKAQLVSIEPHKPGHIPVVLIHGTASSPGRWADMVNDLLEDPEITEHFEFWFFSYATGNPIPYSALQLRKALDKAITDLGGPKADPALGQIVLVGHSQGGLLARMLVINPQDRLWDSLSHHPLASLHMPARTRAFLQAALFPTPMPDIRSVVFIATPHQGSYVAGFSIAHLIGGMVTLPFSITDAMGQIIKGNGDTIKTDMGPRRLGSVYSMSPNSPFIRALAATPIAPDVHTYSIIPVLGDGPLKTADDGVVMYSSAHLPDTVSELVVRHSGHSTQANPITIAEVRRILLQQLAATHSATALQDNTDKADITRMGGQYLQAPALSQP